MRYLFLILLTFSVATSFSQTKQYDGTWTKIGTTYQFDFELILDIDESNQVKGYFVWELVNFDEYNLLSEAYYKNKIGTTAIEFVSGTYNPKEAEYILKGFEKEDPNVIIGMDTYRLKIDDFGNIGGDSNADDTWLGRINGKLNKKEIL